MIQNYLIVLFLAVAMGMIFGIMYKDTCQFHGPNAEKQCQRVLYSKRLKKCIQFGVRVIECPQKLVFLVLKN